MSVQSVSWAASLLVDLPQTTDLAGGDPPRGLPATVWSEPEHLLRPSDPAGNPSVWRGARSLHHSAYTILATFTPSCSAGGVCTGLGCGVGIGHEGGGPETTTDGIGPITPATAHGNVSLQPHQGPTHRVGGCSRWYWHCSWLCTLHLGRHMSRLQM